jgi:hypothetical protein
VYVAVWSRPSSPLNNQRLYRGKTRASFSNMLCLHKEWEKFISNTKAYENPFSNSAFVMYGLTGMAKQIGKFLQLSSRKLMQMLNKYFPDA